MFVSAENIYKCVCDLYVNINESFLLWFLLVSIFIDALHIYRFNCLDLHECMKRIYVKIDLNKSDI